ncbi:MAG: hypothetical protein V7640_1493 [Betaproteobacteria bacterium]
MPVLLVSHYCNAERGPDLAQHAARAGVDIVTLPADREARLPDEICARVDLAFFSTDLFPDYSRQFFSAVRKAPKLQWLHVFNVGVDHPIYTEMLQRGVRLTTSAGSTAEPIAQTAITALLMLARHFPRWLAAQRQHRWERASMADFPRDLQGQTMVIIGLGHIGKEIARLARALRLNVIGIRRSPRQPDDPVDELYAPERLREVLPRADWLVLACPLTAETKSLVNADVLARLPQGAHLINIARGEIVDEAALLAALRSQHLGGAYLDVFQQEPLPADSPFWDMPNVYVTPHNSSAAAGNDRRVYQIFVENVGRWSRSEPLLNEVPYKTKP